MFMMLILPYFYEITLSIPDDIFCLKYILPNINILIYISKIKSKIILEIIQIIKV
jgi:hypothetical protein